jgi:hypothetical protein
MPREVTAGNKPQAVWLSDDADYEDDAFADLAWKAIDPGPVLGREHAAPLARKTGAAPRGDQDALDRIDAASASSDPARRATPRATADVTATHTRSDQRRPLTGT